MTEDSSFSHAGRPHAFVRRLTKWAAAHWWVAWLRDIWNVFIDMVLGWIPPRTMPWVLKVSVLLGGITGAAALVVSQSGISLWRGEFFELVGRPGGRVAMALYGLLGLAQVVLVVARLRIGLYAVWVFNAWLAAVYVWFCGPAGLGMAGWALCVSLYAWFHREWFTRAPARPGPPDAPG
jgi:hypothetical protein